MLNVFQPTLGDEELQAIQEVFKSNWIGKGKKTAKFEQEFAKYLTVDPRQLRATTCCTEGLFQAMALLRLGPEDEVIIPSIGFVGAGNAVASTGARPIFCDVNPRTLNPTVEQIAAQVTPYTKAILLIHYGGVSCEMDAILALAEKHNIAVVEDNACSIASSYKGRACGTLGNIGIWSFDAMKILVCGDGGMIYVKDIEQAHALEESLYLGLTQKSGLSSSGVGQERWWEYEISCFGRRAIMNDMTAAIALEQLKKLPQFIARRKEIHRMYNESLGKLDWLQIPPAIEEHCESSYYFYWVQLKERDALAQYLRNQDIYTTFRYYPLHMVKRYRADATVDLSGVEQAAATTLCIPMHQGLSDEDVETVIKSIKDFRK